MGHFKHKFQTEGGRPPTVLPPATVSVRKLYRVIVLSCGVKISAVHCLVLE